MSSAGLILYEKNLAHCRAKKKNSRKDKREKEKTANGKTERLETDTSYGGPHCLDQKTDLIREPGDSQSPALSFWGSGSAQVSAANRSGATAPKRRPSLLLVYGRAIGPFTVTFPWYTSHGVSYAKLW